MYVALVILMFLSAFFSASEAALFYLDRAQQRSMLTGTRAQRRAVKLLEDPDRLLSAILFCNLVVNMLYFGVVSLIALQLTQKSGAAQAGFFSLGALCVMIIFCEMLPKSISVLIPRRLAALCSLPLLITLRITGPFLPILRGINRLSLRLIWPGFKSEPYLRICDLEQAVKIASVSKKENKKISGETASSGLESGDAGETESLEDAEIKGQDSSEQELSFSEESDVHIQQQHFLERILALSDMKAEEMMCPRSFLSILRPPVTLQDLRDADLSSGFILISEEDTDEIALTVAIKRLPQMSDSQLAQIHLSARTVLYIPWNMRVSDVLELLRKQRRELAVVVNEYGKTTGIITLDDITDSIFAQQSGRIYRLMRRVPIQEVSEKTWHVVGMTDLRFFARYFHLDALEGDFHTVGGAITQVLQHVPETGDTGEWLGMTFKVLESDEIQDLMLEFKWKNDGD